MWAQYAIFLVFQEKPEIQIIVLNCWQLVKFFKNFLQVEQNMSVDWILPHVSQWMMTPDMQDGQAL